MQWVVVCLARRRAGRPAPPAMATRLVAMQATAPKAMEATEPVALALVAAEEAVAHVAKGLQREEALEVAVALQRAMEEASAPMVASMEEASMVAPTSTDVDRMDGAPRVAAKDHSREQDWARSGSARTIGRDPIGRQPEQQKHPEHAGASDTQHRSRVCALVSAQLKALQASGP